MISSHTRRLLKLKHIRSLSDCFVPKNEHKVEETSQKLMESKYAKYFIIPPDQPVSTAKLYTDDDTPLGFEQYQKHYNEKKYWYKKQYEQELNNNSICMFISDTAGSLTNINFNNKVRYPIDEMFELHSIRSSPLVNPIICELLPEHELLKQTLKSLEKERIKLLKSVKHDVGIDFKSQFVANTRLLTVSQRDLNKISKILTMFEDSKEFKVSGIYINLKLDSELQQQFIEASQSAENGNSINDLLNSTKNIDKLDESENMLPILLQKIGKLGLLTSHVSSYGISFTK